MESGFTLVEVLIAAGLLALAFFAVVNLFSTGYSNITYAGRTTTAVALAQQKIERLKAIAAGTAAGQGFDAINATNCSPTPETLLDPLVPSLTYTRTCTLAVNVGVPPLAADLKKAFVRVTWTWADQPRPASVEVEELFTR